MRPQPCSECACLPEPPARHPSSALVNRNGLECPDSGPTIVAGCLHAPSGGQPRNARALRRLATTEPRKIAFKVHQSSSPFSGVVQHPSRRTLPSLPPLPFPHLFIFSFGSCVTPQLLSPFDLVAFKILILLQKSAAGPLTQPD